MELRICTTLSSSTPRSHISSNLALFSSPSSYFANPPFFLLSVYLSNIPEPTPKTPKKPFLRKSRFLEGGGDGRTDLVKSLTGTYLIFLHSKIFSNRKTLHVSFFFSFLYVYKMCVLVKGHPKVRDLSAGFGGLFHLRPASGLGIPIP